MLDNDDADAANDTLPTAEERRAGQKARLGRTLARLKKLTSLPEPSPIIENDMRCLLHQVIDIEPADLIDVIENFGSYVDDLEQQFGEWRAEDDRARRGIRE